MAGEQEHPEPTTATGSLVGRSIDEFVSQLRGFSDRARSIASSVVPEARSLAPNPSERSTR